MAEHAGRPNDDYCGEAGSTDRLSHAPGRVLNLPGQQLQVCLCSLIAWIAFLPSGSSKSHLLESTEQTVLRPASKKNKWRGHHAKLGW